MDNAYLKGRLAPAALGLALLGQLAVEGARAEHAAAPPILGGLLFAAAALLLVLAARAPAGAVPAYPVAAVPDAITGPRGRGWLVCFAGALVCAGAATPLFWQLNARDPHGPAADGPVNTGSWLLYLAALGLFGLAFVLRERGWPNRPAVTVLRTAESLPSRRLEIALVGALTLLALALRLLNLEYTPPGLWFDEAQNGLVGRALVAPGAAHLVFVSDYTQMGALYFYFVGLAVGLFGNLAWPVRLLPALSGAALVPLLYLLGARLYGWRTGLAAAGLVAISSWNITFSRYGIDVLPTVALDVALYLCLVQGLRSGRLGYFAGAGVLLGLNLQTYYIARLAPILLVILFVRLLIGQYRRARSAGPAPPVGASGAAPGPGPLLRALARPALVFCVGAGLAFLPVGLFAVEQPAAFNQRVNIVSIFRPDMRVQHPDLLQTNIGLHLLMFNWQGDPNPKQDLPGAPMLDWVSAALFAAGAGTCLLRLRRGRYFFPLVWLLVSMTAGVLSIDAPHSQRTIENSAVSALIGGIFLGEVWQIWSRGRPAECTAGRPVWRRLAQASAVSALSILVCLAVAGGFSLYRYFAQQVTDRSVWWEMNAPEAQAGRDLAQYRGTRDIFLDRHYYEPTNGSYLAATRYLAPGPDAAAWNQTIPLAPGRDAMILLHPVSDKDMAALTRIYPHATVDYLRAPHDPRPLMYTVFIPASDRDAPPGVHASLSDPGATRPRAEATLPGLSFDWSAVGVHPGLLRMTATLRVDRWAGYTYQWHSATGNPGTGGFLIDDLPQPPGVPLWLTNGLHSIVVTDTVSSSAGVSQLLRTPYGGTQEEAVPTAALFDPRSSEPQGVTALFRAGSGFGSPVAAHRVDRQVDFCFQGADPLPRPYTAEWTGRLWVPQAGTYRLATEQTGKSRLYLDDQLVLVNRAADTLSEVAAPLSAGWHGLRLLMQDAAQTQASFMRLYWIPPDRPQSIIPATFLWPFQGWLPEDSSRPTLDQASGIGPQPCPAGP